MIDATLRAWIRKIDPGRGAIAMFPTPGIDYFRRHLGSPHCKPHLSALGRELFALDTKLVQKPIGGTFTRFMIAGFATYRALAMLGIASYEGYPDLQFRLWSEEGGLPAKSKGRAGALVARQEIIARIATESRCRGNEAIRTLDQADAAILALGAAVARAEGTNVVIEHRAEGRFLIALPAEHEIDFDA